MKTRIEVAKELLSADFIKNNDDYKDFMTATLTSLEKRQMSAKKKRENPEHKRIMSAISSKFPTGAIFCIKDITTRIDDVSQNKASAIMKKLVDNGYATRTVGKNKAITYKMEKTYVG